ncbi:glycoside hydrolase family 65 protein [Kitasatospora sp. CB01950]|uniref:glycoside hydrolase family 65 protein n=1 Tax=Kitasatospora sp. CB01950 TaxID=1703930 RepID=UPI000A8CDA12|nr:glycosyl hydrolase family 65 protein [Kitasatospora sp. CB01950]
MEPDPTGTGCPMPDPWTLRYTGYAPAEEGLREALCAVGNGYLVTRGAAPEAVAGGEHYPGTYLAGCYDRADSVIGGRVFTHEDLVNCPNWLPVTFRPADGEWFAGPPAEQELELDLRRGVLTRRAVCVDAAGRRTRLVQRRLASQARPHLAALETELTAENWSGRLDVRSALDGAVTNAGVPRYAGLDSHHLTTLRQEACPEGELWLEVATGAGRRIALAARHRVRPGCVALHGEARPGQVAQTLAFDVAPGLPVTVDKVVAVHTSHDPATGDPLDAARRLAAEAPAFDRLLAEHARRWEQLWRRCRIDADFPDPGPLHLDLFHLLQSWSEHSADLDVGVPARGLHGEAYRGHVFWDELFVLRVLDLRFPELARAALRYRHRRLDAARRAARAEGRRGAAYPWQSAADGREQSPQVHLNPRSGHWLPDHTHLQRHIGSAVAYNIWEYYRATGDHDFLAEAGAETLLEIARYWASAATHDPARGHWSIRGVLGPDEYHDAYPWADAPGLDDNAYTNVLASWVLARARDALHALPARRRDELTERLALDTAETDHWQDIGHHLHVPFHDGVISQFDGYRRLAELDWDTYRRRYPDLRRLDRILEAEGDTVNRYRASKQADVLMLWYLFPAREVHELLRRLGHPAGDELMRRTVDYYLDRTVHGSTLSSVVHAWVLGRCDPHASWRHFRDALTADLHDSQGGTTREGIHLGAMAGAVDLLQRCYTGLESSDDGVRLDPHLPGALHSITLDLRHRGRRTLRITVDRRHVTVALDPDPVDPVRIAVRGERTLLRPGQSHTFRL